jgi:hypothetical protein
MTFPVLSIAFSSLFILILVLLHFLKPELDPKWRMISEYEIGESGWLMRLAFFAWSGGVISAAIAIARAGPAPNPLIIVWLSAIALCLIGAGAFRTNPITETKPSIVNTIHTACGALVILTFPIIGTIVCRSYASIALSPAPVHLVVMTVAMWIGQIGFFSSISISRKLDPRAGRVGPTVYLGWPNRIMVLFYQLWLISFSAGLIG